jgi:hypothetical protein
VRAAACRREVHAAETTYALRVMCTVPKSFVYRAIAFNLKEIIGPYFSPFIHRPFVRRKSSERAERLKSLFNSANCTPADTPRSSLFGFCRRGAS